MPAKLPRVPAAAAALAFGLTCSAIAQEQERLNVLGTEMLVKMDGEQTGGAMSVVEITVPPVHSLQLHLHSGEDELLYVIDGQFRIWRGDEVLEVGTGAVAFLPRNVPHTYQNVISKPGRLLVAITPGAFVGFFREVSQGNLSSEDIKELEAVASKYGLQFIGTPPEAH